MQPRIPAYRTPDAALCGHTVEAPEDLAAAEVAAVVA